MKWALSIACAFFLGATLGFLAGSRGRDAGPAEPSPSSSGAEPLPQASGEMPAPPESSTGQPAVERAIPVPAAFRSLAEAIESIPAPAVEAGTGVIQGRVVSDSGEPVAGVRIRADRVEEHRPRRGRQRGAGEDAGIEEKVVNLVKWERWSRAERREAITDGSGAYRLTGLAEASYHLSASAEGFSLEHSRRTPSRDVQPGSTVDFVARALIEVPVAVLLPDGTPAREAFIESSRPADRNSWTRQMDWSSEEPRIRLTRGYYTLTAVDARNSNLRSEPAVVSLRPGVVVEKVTLHIKARPGIEGKVLFPGDEFPGSIYVYVLKVNPGSAPDLERLREDGKKKWLSSDVRFAFADLAAGTYLLGASRGDAPIAVTETVAVGDGPVVQDLAIPPLERGEYVVLHVLGPEGEAVEDVEVSTGCRHGNWSSSGGGTMIRRPDGSYWVLHHPSKPEDREDSQATYHIEVSSGRYGKKKVEYQLGEVHDFTIQFTSPATLEVEVAGYAGSGLEDQLRVHLEATGTEEKNRHYFGRDEERLDADGRKTLGPLEPGRYQVVLLAKQGRHEFRPIQSSPVTLQPGKNRVTLTLPRLYTLRVIVDDPARAEKLHISSTTREGGSHSMIGGKAEPGGRVVFEGLSPGEYRLALWGGGLPEEMRVTLPGPLEVRFEPQPMNALLVTVDEPEGTFAKAGLRTGDLVIGVNGKECANLLELQARFLGSLAEKEVSLLVLRGEERFEAKLDPQALIKNEDLGGNLEPASR